MKGLSINSLFQSVANSAEDWENGRILEGCGNSNETEINTVFKDSLKIINFVLVWFLVFGLAGSVELSEFNSRFKSKGIYVGLACQFFMLPLIGFIVVLVADLDPTYSLILLVIVASPGGSYSNWWCNLINADLALSVAMTTVSTLVSIFMLPLNVIFYAEFLLGKVNEDVEGAEIPWQAVGQTLAVVVTSIVCGLVFGVKFPEKQVIANNFGNICGMLSIALGGIASLSSDKGPQDQPLKVYIAAAIPMICGISFAFVVSSFFNLAKYKRVAISIETAYQNTAIALSVALAIDPCENPKGQEATFVPVIYGVYEATFFLVFSIISWKAGWTLSPSTDPIRKVFFNDYQHRVAEVDREWAETLKKKSEEKNGGPQIEAVTNTVEP